MENLFSRVVSMPQLKDQLQSFMNATRYVCFTRDPLLSIATIFWLKEKLYDVNFYDWTSFTMSESPAAFHILDEISITQPLHQPYVFNVWKSLILRGFAMAPLMMVVQFKPATIPSEIH
jgi:hypothetical protein